MEFATTVLRNAARPVVPPPILIVTLVEKPMSALVGAAVASIFRMTKGKHSKSTTTFAPNSPTLAPDEAPEALKDRDDTERDGIWLHSREYRKLWPTSRLIDLIDKTASMVSSIHKEARWRRIFLSRSSGLKRSMLVPIRAATDLYPEEDVIEGDVSFRGGPPIPPKVVTDKSTMESGTVESSDEYDEVHVHDGYNEKVARLIFPYADKFAGVPRSGPLMHMTILANGAIENTPKELVLAGDKVQQERALCSFPFRQTMDAGKADEHMKNDPHRNFVWRREDGSYAVCQVTICVCRLQNGFKTLFHVPCLPQPLRSDSSDV